MTEASSGVTHPTLTEAARRAAKRACLALFLNVETELASVLGGAVLSRAWVGLFQWYWPQAARKQNTITPIK
jgi:hypothetical protein